LHLSFARIPVNGAYRRAAPEHSAETQSKWKTDDVMTKSIAPSRRRGRQVLPNGECHQIAEARTEPEEPARGFLTTSTRRRRNIKHSLGIGAVGLVDTVYILVDWTKILLPPSTPLWVGTCAAGTAAALLVMATWLILPGVLSWIRKLIDGSLWVHATTNRAILYSVLYCVRAARNLLRRAEMQLTKFAEQPAAAQKPLRA
jgi:hypothetical protein